MTKPLKQCVHGETKITLSPLMFGNAKKWLQMGTDNGRDQLAKQLVHNVVNEIPPYTDDDDHTAVSAAHQLNQELQWYSGEAYKGFVWKASLESAIKFYVEEVGEGGTWTW